ncbi:hypothetical protein JQ604_09010 [Bradyrhizobium jicamae]|uniref:hypothetical protein n=1 Tax=Bradyrhizobium jicamae TaxID=280332 RepID=UPI001BA5FF21|nr:hypothetical protein [Bradyrhizobium jicamae]MBR0752322.1 hypothetical protein [Bradyrhizobium jicamae]
MLEIAIYSRHEDLPKQTNAYFLPKLRGRLSDSWATARFASSSPLNSLAKCLWQRTCNCRQLQIGIDERGARSSMNAQVRPRGGDHDDE